MSINSWPGNWTLRVYFRLYFCSVWISSAVASYPNYEKNTLTSLSSFELDYIAVNKTDEFSLGISNDPFGEKFLSAKGKNRRKRGVVSLYNMVSCATGCDPLTYKGYGCYCGFLGSGFAVDGIDRCCQMHDWCYDSSGCPVFLEYFIPYLWKCYQGTPLCGVDVGSLGSCAQRLCHCDQLLAKCLRRYPCPSTKALCTSSPWRLLQNIFML